MVAGIRNHTDGDRVGGVILEEKPVRRRFQNAGFYAEEIILIWLQVRLPVGMAGDGAGDDVPEAIPSAGE